MKGFRIKRESHGADQQPIQKKDTMLLKWYRYVQHAWVRIMERLTAERSKKTMMAYLIAFLCFGVGYNVLILAGFMTFSKIHVDPIKAPGYVEQPSELIDRSEIEVQKHQIETFRNYMDSLAASPETKAQYDSILKHRPGLMDSVERIREFLNNQ